MNLFKGIKKGLHADRSNTKPQKSDIESNKPLTGRLEVDLTSIRETFEKSSDVIIREFQIGKETNKKGAILYTSGLADTKTIHSFIMESLMFETDTSDFHNFNSQSWRFFYWIKNRILTIGDVTEISCLEELFTEVLSGNTVIIIDGFQQAISASTTGWEDRAVTEPTSQTVVRGPQEGFTESLRKNTALIRRKIKDSNLCCEQLRIGRVTKTSIAVMYIEGIANDKIVQEVHERLNRIDVDGILEGSNIEELIQDKTFTPFPTVYNTERPDVIAGGLLEGRIAIIVDGTPFVLLVPALFIHSFQSAEDYYQRADISTLLRILRYICFFISLLAPSLYIAVTTYHQEMLPTSLLISLAAQREGVPFPAFVEAMIMEFTFEVLREAGVRLPKAVGQAISIVGALVVGQAAVEAGIVSASMVIIVSITAIANFVFPAFNMAIAVRMLRFIMMALAASLGLYGITLGILTLILHLNSLRSFGIPYMAPMSPFIMADQKDAIIRIPFWGLISRPKLISQKNIVRAENTPVTKPKANRE
ncbi:spore germination protein [Niallia oryzisoli]|uniref:spore germination protein n=1 Tax=Niallia oryzisoli TaxID=1737571 RepID=UPI0037370AC4